MAVWEGGWGWGWPLAVAERLGNKLPEAPRLGPETQGKGTAAPLSAEPGAQPAEDWSRSLSRTRNAKAHRLCFPL